jgi:hypothetical protein
MSHRTRTFVDLCLDGEALADDIDDFVDEWHDGGTGIPLYRFLGFTHDEYKLWVERPNSLDLILYARKYDRGLDEVRTADQFHRLAARSLSADDRDELIAWLKQTGRLTD